MSSATHVTLPGRVATLHRMQKQIATWDKAGDRRAIFLTVYSMMTERITAGIKAGAFDDPVFMDLLLRTFAVYYFGALEAYEAHGTPPLAWQRAHDLAGEPVVLAQENLLLGINAHINHDLALSLYDLLKDEWGADDAALRASRLKDFNTVNSVIATLMDDVEATVCERYDGPLGRVEHGLTQVMHAAETVVSNVVTAWRDEVWQHGIELVEAPGPEQRDLLRQQLEEGSLQRVHAVLTGAEFRNQLLMLPILELIRIHAQRGITNLSAFPELVGRPDAAAQLEVLRRHRARPSVPARHWLAGEIASAEHSIEPRVRQRLVTFDGLERGTRVLVYGGYAALFLLLAITLAASLVGNRIPAIHVEASTVRADLPALALPPLGFFWALGWTLLLVAAVEFRLLWGTGVLLLALLTAVMFGGPDGTNEGLVFLGWLITIPAFIVSRHLRRRTRRAPILAVAAVLFVSQLLIPLLLMAGSGGSLTVANNIFAAASLVALIAIPFWAMLALEATEGSLSIGRALVRREHRWMGARAVIRTTTPLILFITGVSLGLLLLGNSMMVLYAVVIGPLLLLVALVVRLARRRGVASSAILQATAVALFAMVYGLSRDLDLPAAAGGPVHKAGLLPPALLFVALVIFNTISFGARLTRTDGRHFPRTGRVLAYLGATILITCSALLLFGAKDTNGINMGKMFTHGIEGFGIMVFGLPYLGWLLWRRRHELVPGELRGSASAPAA